MTIYKDFNINTVRVVYSINEQRNPVNELIITNYKTC
ncbi:DNA methyltransferase [Orientia tsutsugamushi]